ncbi:hypothetical protein [Sporocytophaga myxococcoides]|nr:hypothetical protein [Sporocytophaga myxococcoides]
MKIRNLLIVFTVVFSLASCYGHRTCPTYLKKDLKEIKTEKVKV